MMKFVKLVFGLPFVIVIMYYFWSLFFGMICAVFTFNIDSMLTVWSHPLMSTKDVAVYGYGTYMLFMFAKKFTIISVIWFTLLVSTDEI